MEDFDFEEYQKTHITCPKCEGDGFFQCKSCGLEKIGCNQCDGLGEIKKSDGNE